MKNKKDIKKAEAKYKKAKKTSKFGSGKRFSALSDELEAKGAKDPGALAAYIGRKKYGAKKMASASAAGRRRSSNKYTGKS